MSSENIPKYVETREKMSSNRINANYLLSLDKTDLVDIANSGSNNRFEDLARFILNNPNEVKKYKEYLNSSFDVTTLDPNFIRKIVENSPTFFNSKSIITPHEVNNYYFGKNNVRITRFNSSIPSRISNYLKNQFRLEGEISKVDVEFFEESPFLNSTQIINETQLRDLNRIQDISKISNETDLQDLVIKLITDISSNFFPLTYDKIKGNLLDAEKIHLVFYTIKNDKENKFLLDYLGIGTNEPYGLSNFGFSDIFNGRRRQRFFIEACGIKKNNSESRNIGDNYFSLEYKPLYDELGNLIIKDDLFTEDDFNQISNKREYFRGQLDLNSSEFLNQQFFKISEQIRKYNLVKEQYFNLDSKLYDLSNIKKSLISRLKTRINEYGFNQSFNNYIFKVTSEIMFNNLNLKQELINYAHYQKTDRRLLDAGIILADYIYTGKLEKLILQ